MSEKNEFIPFLSLEELECHLSCSQSLIAIILGHIKELRKAENTDTQELERTTIKSLEVLNSGLANMITSIKEGYIK